MSKHQRKTLGHEGASMSPCLVQRASTFARHPYYEVAGHHQAPEAMSGGMGDEMSDEAIQECLRVIRAREDQELASATDDGSSTGPFYGYTLWHRLSDLLGVPIPDLVRVTFSEADVGCVDLIKSLALVAMGTINRVADVGFRFAIHHGGRPFKMLQQEDSRDAYASVLGRFVLFLRRIAADANLCERFIPVEVRAEVLSFVSSPTADGLWDVLCALLEISPVAVMPQMHPFLLFVRCVAMSNPEAPMEPEKIGRLFAKVYLNSLGHCLIFFR